MKKNITKNILLFGLLYSTISFGEMYSKNECNYSKKDISSIVKQIYPPERFDQITNDVASIYFHVVLSHKSSSPFVYEQGPSLGPINYCNEPISFVSRQSNGKIKLIFFNWNYSVPKILKVDKNLSKIYGSTVYKIDDFPQKQLTTMNSPFLFPLSYLVGTNFFSEMSKIDRAFTNSRYLDKTAFGNPNQIGLLYDALGVYQIPVVNMDHGEYVNFYVDGLPKYIKDNPVALSSLTTTIDQEFPAQMIKLSLHEPVHIRQANDLISGKFGRRLMVEQYSEPLVSLFSGPRSAEIESKLEEYRLKSFCFVSKYYSVEKWSKEIKEGAIKDLESILGIISDIKNISPELFLNIQSYEFIEGIPEYVRVQSLLDVGNMTFDQGFSESLIGDKANSFYYQTGAIAALFIRKHIGFKAFTSGDDREFSIWEIVFREVQKINETQVGSIFSAQCNLEIPKDRVENQLMLDYINQGKQYIEDLRNQ